MLFYGYCTLCQKCVDSKNVSNNKGQAQILTRYKIQTSFAEQYFCTIFFFFRYLRGGSFESRRTNIKKQLLWEPKLYYRDCQNPSLVPVLSQMYPAHSTSSNLFIIQYNNIVPVLRFPMSCLSSRLCSKYFVCIFRLPSTLHVQSFDFLKTKMRDI